MVKQHGWKALFLVLAILLLAINLRPGATSIGPVLQEIRDGLGMSATDAGLLGALPGLIFAVVGLTATLLARRFGLTGSLILASSAIAAGLILRPFLTSVSAFFLCTILALSGMAIGNVLVPPFIRRSFPFRTAAITTVYTTGIALGGTIPSLVSAPLAAVSDWRYALLLWGLSAAVAVAAWIGVGVMNRGSSEQLTVQQKVPTVPIASLLRSPKAVALGVFFGMQSTQAYVQFAWVPQMFRDGGLSAEYSGTLLAIIPALGIPGAFLMPTVVSKARSLTHVVLLFSGLLAIGYLGILYFPTTMPVLWVLALGISGMCFPMAISLITVRSREVAVTAPLSALTQSLGYTFAAIGPFVIGALHDVSGGWHAPLWLLIGSAAVLAISGIYAARPGYVDDEIRPATA